jgi:D-alanyl-D-alanine dipeptidase
MMAGVNLFNRYRLTARIFVCSLALAAVPVALRAQTEAAPAAELAPGPKPADVSGEWRRLVGIYGPAKEQDIILERDGALYWRDEANKEEPIYPATKGQGTFLINNSIEFIAQSDAVGSVTELVMGTRQKPLPRADAGADPAHFYRVTPLKPIDELRAAALLQSPPEEEGPFRKPELVELTTLDAAIHLDIRYAKSNNFLSTPVYTEARAFMQRPAAEALIRVLHKLQPLGYGLLIHDAYRPWYVTKIFWEATPTEGRIFVADPKKGSKHNRGCAADLTLYDLATGKAIEMTGLYDEMSPRSFPTFPGGTSLQRWHRDLLRRAMESEGFTVNEEEWWHFDYKDWKQYPILNLSFEKIGAGS